MCFIENGPKYRLAIFMQLVMQLKTNKDMLDMMFKRGDKLVSWWSAYLYNMATENHAP